MAIPGEQWKGYPLLPLPMRGGTPLKCVASKGPCVSAVTIGYKESLEDLLASFGPVSIRNMFSGAGVYAEGVMFAIVVNDRRNLYPAILDRAGLRLDERLRRHVNRRTGRRAGEYFEDVLVVRKL